MIHYLKVWPPYFDRLSSYDKTFEVRKNDRDFQTGDTLELAEYDPQTKTYSGRTATRHVSYILHGDQFGIEKGYCVLGLTSQL